MVDADLRSTLSLDLRRLVAGRLTNDEFDDRYFDVYAESEDRGVARIAEFGYSLYSSDTWRPYRLRGKQRLDRLTRRIAARCILLLRSDLEYEWPPLPSSLTADMLATFVAVGVPVGGIVSLIAIPALFLTDRDAQFWRGTAALGAAITLGSVWYVWRHSRRKLLARRSWEAAGDVDVWPFRRREDFYRARRGEACDLANRKRRVE